MATSDKQTNRGRETSVAQFGCSGERDAPLGTETDGQSLSLVDCTNGIELVAAGSVFLVVSILDKESTQFVKFHEKVLIRIEQGLARILEERGMLRVYFLFPQTLCREVPRG